MVERFRRWLHIDWLCQGCWGQGSQRWLTKHSCPERDRWQAEARERHKSPYWFVWVN